MAERPRPVGLDLHWGVLSAAAIEAWRRCSRPQRGVPDRAGRVQRTAKTL